MATNVLPKSERLYQRLIEKEKALGDELTFAYIVDEVAGVYPKIMHEGTMEV